ncbi:hypothetical protein HMPREF1327_01371 [Enterococcus faecalis 599]|uniref:Uncharacterized protein n=2 Tax=Enterococcus TaxID=1350 RepID=A0A4Y5QLM2_ENTFC|nr:hypothetical protein [Enterococcus avium]EJU90928.1 hypothetical protein HMPREF1327_01371 [Enterococcus faecalis 599]QCX35259.1 hypothetical protein [Enterococcus faecium]QCX35281.1 hypothetical protein [Enterococcus faecium]QCX35304.1 hypothetical protein [Enterococcus faecium]
MDLYAKHLSTGILLKTNVYCFDLYSKFMSSVWDLSDSRKCHQNEAVIAESALTKQK